MKFFLKAGIIFLGLNFLISLPIYFFLSKSLGLESMYLLSYFTIVLLLLEFLSFQAQKLGFDLISIGLGIKIGLKFFLNLIFVALLILSNTMITLPSMLLFLVYFSLYTFLMLYLKSE